MPARVTIPGARIAPTTVAAALTSGTRARPWSRIAARSSGRLRNSTSACNSSSTEQTSM